jgi:tripartite-type tricarboxylate transporter receptor subunit TctC
MPDLVSGKVDLLFDSIASALPHIKDGRVKALGISSAKPSPLLPGVPAIVDSVPGYVTMTWFGLYGPKGLPQDVTTRLNTALNQALQDADVKDRLARLGIEPVGGTPQQFASMAETDRAKWKKIISERKLTAE